MRYLADLGDLVDTYVDRGVVGGVDVEECLSVVLRHRAAQGLVPSDDVVHRSAQSIDLESSDKTDAEGNVIGDSSIRVETRRQPEPLLRGRQRDAPVGRRCDLVDGLGGGEVVVDTRCAQCAAECGEVGCVEHGP